MEYQVEALTVLLDLTRRGLIYIGYLPVLWSVFYRKQIARASAQSPLVSVEVSFVCFQVSSKFAHHIIKDLEAVAALRQKYPSLSVFASCKELWTLAGL